MFKLLIEKKTKLVRSTKIVKVKRILEMKHSSKLAMLIRKIVKRTWKCIGNQILWYIKHIIYIYTFAEEKGDCIEFPLLIKFPTV